MSWPRRSLCLSSGAAFGPSCFSSSVASSWPMPRWFAPRVPRGSSPSFSTPGGDWRRSTRHICWRFSSAWSKYPTAPLNGRPWSWISYSCRLGSQWWMNPIHWSWRLPPLAGLESLGFSAPCCSTGNSCGQRPDSVRECPWNWPCSHCCAYGSGPRSCFTFGWTCALDHFGSLWVVITAGFVAVVASNPWNCCQMVT